jgi:hypothetical protein
VLAQEIVGVWRLVEWVQRYDDGRSARPLGSGAYGTLIYTVGGQMSGVVAAGDRSPFAGGKQWDAPEAERAAAYSSFLAYAGTYTVDGGWVVHHVRTSLFPNWVGRDMRRSAELTANRLTLTGRIEDGTPQARTITMVFERIE